MTRCNYKNGRMVYNDVGDKTVKSTKCENLKVKTDTKKQFGSGKMEAKEISNTSKKKRFPNIKSVEKNVLQYIIGQDTQVRQILTAIYRAIKFKTFKSNVLIIGNSGTGKTEIIKQIAKRLNIPYTIEDATKYTQEGYYGDDVTDMIFNLLDNANYDIEMAQNGIIVIDEIDKKVGHEEHDVSGVEVLKSLLKIIEGAVIKIPIEDPFNDEVINFDTSNLIIIFLGAFIGLDKIRDKRLNINSIGFAKDNIANDKNQSSKFIKQDLVMYGMPEEFAGRIDTIIEMNKLTKQDLVMILKKSKLSIFKKYKDEFKKMGITLSYNNQLFENIAEKSLALDTGARELSNTVNYMFENIMYDILANPKKYKKCTLELDIVNDNTKYKLS